jgi:hypothetical protein
LQKLIEVTSVRSFLFSIGLLSVTVISNALADDLSGTWTGQFGGRGYQTDQTLTVTKSGRKWHVSFETVPNEQITDVQVKGDFLSFNIQGDLIRAQRKGDTLELRAGPHDEATGVFRRLKAGEPVPPNSLMQPEMTQYWSPVPKVVDPGPYPGMVPPPSDAIVLFDGKDLSKWMSRDGSDAKWSVVDGSVTVVPGTGDISTRQRFGDYQLHVEWRVPADVQGTGQNRGNSGLFLQDMTYDSHIGWDWYEIQILDSYQNPTYVNGQAASVYKQHAPLVNAMRKPGEWNVYDVTYTAPRFKEDGSIFLSPVVTVFHNGILVQDHFAIRGNTLYVGLPQNYAPHGKAPISLQDHFERISFRNIWIREIQ